MQTWQLPRVEAAREPQPANGGQCKAACSSDSSLRVGGGYEAKWLWPEQLKATRLAARDL